MRVSVSVAVLMGMTELMHLRDGLRRMQAEGEVTMRPVVRVLMDVMPMPVPYVDAQRRNRLAVGQRPEARPESRPRSPHT